MKISLSETRTKLAEAHDQAEAIDQYLQEIIREFRRFGDRNIGFLTNLKTSYVEVTSGLANVEFTVTHGLGVIPFMHISNVDVGGVIYDSRRVDWTSTAIYLKCTAAAAAVRCLVLGQ